MPNFDGGHYFLTALLPVKSGTDPAVPGASHVNQLRDVLAHLPTALQSPASERRGVNAPFARNLRAHFLRLVVIDDVSFNGREGNDTLVVSLLTKLAPRLFRSLDPMTPNKVDHLPNSYLILAADFDAASGAVSELDAWLRELWGSMEAELRSILDRCHGFDTTGRAKQDADDFVRYIMRCQVETTMPFNDYWQVAPALGKLGIPLAGLIAPPAVAALICVAGLLLAWLGSPWLASLGRWAAWIGLAGILLGVAYAYLAVLRRGARPLPRAPDSDLRSVLKSLYLRQHFIRFAITTQGVGAAELHAAFGAFIDTHHPDDVAAPTQAPGVVRSVG